MNCVLDAAGHARMLEHLRAAYPEEGCGVLIGGDRDGVRDVARVLCFENRREDERARRYLIAPEQVLEAERQAREAGLDVVGFFHSHPDHPAEPSAFDLEHAWPFYTYVIVSVRQGRIADVRAWRMTGDRSRFEPENLTVVPGGATAEEEGASSR